VLSPCPRLDIAATVAINTTVRGEIRTWVLTPQSDALTTRPLRPARDVDRQRERPAETAPQHEAAARRSAANAGSAVLTAELTRLNTDLLCRRNVYEKIYLQSSMCKSSPYSITERRVPELIPVLGSEPAGEVSHKPGGIGCHYFPPGLQLPPQPLRGLLPILLLGEQRHNGCEQFAQDCYPTAVCGVKKM